MSMVTGHTWSPKEQGGVDTVSHTGDIVTSGWKYQHMSLNRLSSVMINTKYAGF